MSKPTLTAYGRTWPLEEIPQVNVRITFSLPAGDLDAIHADIERRLAGIEGAGVKVEDAVLMRIPEPERTEYNQLMDRVYRSTGV